MKFIKKILCPSCKKPLEMEATTCSKCNHTITQEERTKGVKQAKKISIIMIAVALLFSIGVVFNKDEDKNNDITITENTPQVKPKTDAEIEAEIAELKVEISMATKEFISLHDQLTGFRYNSNFHRVGFGEGGAYYSWLEKVRSAQEKFSNPAQLQSGLIFGELAQMGLEYMRNQGNDTDITLFFLPDMKKAMGR